jgi:hypothetical protein
VTGKNGPAGRIWDPATAEPQLNLMLNIFTGKKVLIAPQWIERISWEDSRVYINLTKENIKQSPEYTHESELTRDYETSLFGYYKKTPYWSAEPQTHDYTHSQVDTQGKYSGY